MTAHPFEWLSFRAKVAYEPHPLEGKMWVLFEGQIADQLMWHPPTKHQAMILALEEMRRPIPDGGDRAVVYRLLHEATAHLP